MAVPRNCKGCGVPIASRKHYCDDCLTKRYRQRVNHRRRETCFCGRPLIPADVTICGVCRDVAALQERECLNCRVVLPLTKFRPQSGAQAKVYYSRRCARCDDKLQFGKRLEKTYGIDTEIYDRLLAIQGGVCFICRRPPKAKRLAVDHDHKTGIVRGLLCSRCNTMIGRGMEKADVFRRAMEYLMNPPYEQL